MKRSNNASKSHGDRPNLKTHSENRKRIVLKSTKHEMNFGNVEDKYIPMQQGVVTDAPDENLLKRLASRSSTLTPISSVTSYGSICSGKTSFRMSMFGGYKVSVPADGLDMDHHYISFGQYLFWAMVMVR